MKIDNITEFQHYIRLVVDDKLTKPWPAIFWKSVKNTGPDDIVKYVQTYDRVGEVITKYMRHYEKDEKHIYEIPLNRNLTAKETEKIILVWTQKFDESHGDFIIETSTPCDSDETFTAELENDNDNISEIVVMRNHTYWLNEKIKDGWRYGLNYSLEEKTHPLMLPWEQLPKKYKNNDARFSSFLSSLLGENNGV
jgi:hypothetical protein